MVALHFWGAPTHFSTSPHCHRLVLVKLLGHVSERPEWSHNSVRTLIHKRGLCVCVCLCVEVLGVMTSV